jgi:long-chain acyl-CoA synthetase
LGELKKDGGNWIRSGRLEVQVGEPLRFDPETSEAEITERLHAVVSALLEGSRQDSDGSYAGGRGLK